MIKKKLVSVAIATLLITSNAFVFADQEQVKQEIKIKDVMSLEDAQKEALANTNLLPILDLDKKIKELALEKAGNAERNFKRSKKISVAGNVEEYMLDDKVMSLKADLDLKHLDLEKQYKLETLKNNVTKAYYSVLNAQNAYQAALDNLEHTNRSFEIIKSKNQLGVASKSDLIFGEISLKDAQLKVQKSKDIVDSAKMAFNKLLNYPLTHSVTLTSSFIENKKDYKLEDDVKKALDTRRDIIELRDDLDVSKKDLKANSYMYTPNTYVYQEKELNINKMEQGFSDLKLQIEFEVRNQSNVIKTSLKEIESQKYQLEKTKEALRLVELSYEAGLKTVQDVREARNQNYVAQIGLYDAISNYNLALLEYDRIVNLGS